MKKSNKLFIITILIFLSISLIFPADKIDELVFTNTEITEVLKTISEIFQITIVPDKDVKGEVTRYFRKTDLQQTLTLLLEPLNFIYEIKDGIYFVKKKPLYSIEYSKETKLFIVKSDKARLMDIVIEMAKTANETVKISDNNDMVTAYIFNKNIEDTLKLLIEDLNYEMKKEGNVIFLKKTIDDDDSDPSKTKKTTGITIKGDENNLNIKVSNKSSNDLVMELFKKFNKKVSFLSNKSIVIPYLNISNVTFDSALNIIFEHSNQAFSKYDDVYYVFDSLGAGSSNPHMVSTVYKLKNIDHTDIPTLVPPQIIPHNSFKIDTENNLVIIFGSDSEVAQYLDFIKSVDTNRESLQYRYFKLNYIDAKNIKKYLPKKYQKLEVIIIEEQNMFGAMIDKTDFDFLKDYFELMDISTKNQYIYKFKYLNPEDVVKSMLPKSIKPEEVVLNKNNSSLIFYVSENEKDQLFAYLESIDIPSPIIRYQLLIIEYQDTNDFNFNWSLGINKKKDITDFSFDAGVFWTSDGVIDANFDIPTIFGPSFSFKLVNQLISKTAKVRLSTEVYGISGETVNLTNTKTLQYKDTITNNEDNTTRPVYNSTTFGLNINLKGRATSGDEVFVEVTVKMSDEIPGSGENEAPNTSEKSVKNSIRSKTGKPIVLGGLTDQKENAINNKIPLLADIPYIGEAFKTHNNTYSNSEFVIYIIPFIQKSDEDIKTERKNYIKKIYDYFVDG